MLLGLVFILPQPHLASAQDGAVERLHRFLGETRTLRADFRQTVLDEEGRLVEEAAGKVSLARPGRFRWVYERPHAQQIVGDGEQMWIYDPDLDQVTVSEMDSALGPMPSMLLYSDRSIEDSFEINALVAEGSLNWFELLPHAEESGFTALRIGLDPHGLKVMEIHDNFGQVIRIDFDALETDVSFPEDHFLFVPPEGADVFRR